MEGVVKFNVMDPVRPVISDEQYANNKLLREILYYGPDRAYENGVGLGNISMRIRGGNQFIITVGTGEIPELEPALCKSQLFNIDDNAVQCTGPLKASSESLTHAAIYLADPDVNAVVHVHSIDLWNEIIYKVPTTNPSMDYGTTGLAKDIFRLFSDSDVFEKRIIVMAGDRAGILTFGQDMDEAVNVLMHYLKRIIKNISRQ